jgi:hypothetical protein
VYSERIRIGGLCVGVVLVLAGATASSSLAASPQRAKASIADFTASPASLGASGGDVRLKAVVHHAVKCRFSADETLSGLPSTKSCRSGKASLEITLPANAGTTLRYYFIFVSAKSADGKSTEQRVVVVEHAPPATAPAITTQPTSQTVVAGQDATFTAAASGSPTPSVQWQESTDGGGTWADAAGATAATFTFLTNSSNNGIELRAVFTNTAGSATTNAVTLTVGVAPAIVQQPGSGETLPSGHSFILFAGASGTPTPSAEWQESTNAGSTWANVGAGSSSVSSGVTYASYSSYASALGSNTEYRAVFTNAAGTATSNAEVLTVNPAISYNWSGYVATGETYTSVIGSWLVPALNCTGDPNAVSSEWVGIDGYNQGDTGNVEQDGSEADCVSGTPTYHAWYEMYGNSGLFGGAQDPIAQPVAAGERITATVGVTGSDWTFEVTDVAEPSGSINWSFMTHVTYAPVPALPQSSAEWIVECTSGCSSPLADFGTVHFTAATAYGNGQDGAITSFPYIALEMLNGSSDPIAVPGLLNDVGEGFNDTWSAG